MANNQITQMLREIGQVGDRIWSGRLSDSTMFEGRKYYIGIRDKALPYWSLFYRARCAADKAPEHLGGGILLLGFLFCLPIDIVQFAVRTVFYPILLSCWWSERRIALWLGRSFFCPVCHNAMKDPYVYCRSCDNRVQGLLRPRFGALFVRTCPGCIEAGRKSKSQWHTLGNYLLAPPSPLVCRDTATTKGCYRPHRLANIAGKYTTKHVAIVGPTIRAKHCVLAGLVGHSTNGAIPRSLRCRPVCPLSVRETHFMRLGMLRSMYQDTGPFETPGTHYTLARSLVLQRNRTVVTLHNICHTWLGDEKRLYTRGISWRETSTLIFVVDAPLLQGAVKEHLTSHVEVLSRLIRVVEKRLSLLPGSRLPFRIAVVMPIPVHDKLTRSLDSAEAIDPRQLELTISASAPAFYALVKRSVRPKDLRFFGGQIPDNDQLTGSRWLHELIAWVMWEKDA